jgi:hypothetical protein
MCKLERESTARTPSGRATAAARSGPSGGGASCPRTAVSQWNAQLEAGGMEALKSRRRGRRSGLDDAQRGQLMRALTAGALAEGFATDLCSMQRRPTLVRAYWQQAELQF